MKKLLILGSDFGTIDIALKAKEFTSVFYQATFYLCGSYRAHQSLESIGRRRLVGICQ